MVFLLMLRCFDNNIFEFTQINLNYLDFLTPFCDM